MAKKPGKIRKALSKEVDLPINLPDNKLGNALSKKRSAKNLWPAYFRNSWRELKKVTWPSRKESWQLVLAVILFTAIFTLITAIADYGINQLVEEVIL